MYQTGVLVSQDLPLLERKKYAPNPGKQRQPPTMSAHHLDHERPGMRARSGVDIIDALADAVQGRRGADGHVGEGHVVVDGAYEAYYAQVRVGRGLLWRYQVYRSQPKMSPTSALSAQDKIRSLTLLPQFLNKPRPLRPQPIRPRQTPIAPTNNKRLNPLPNQVMRSLEPPLGRAERAGSRSADERPAFAQPAAHVVPPDAHDVSALERPPRLPSPPSSSYDMRIALPADQQLPIAEPQVVQERGIE